MNQELIFQQAYRHLSSLRPGSPFPHDAVNVRMPDTTRSRPREPSQVPDRLRRGLKKLFRLRRDEARHQPAGVKRAVEFGTTNNTAELPAFDVSEPSELEGSVPPFLFELEGSAVGFVYHSVPNVPCLSMPPSMPPWETWSRILTPLSVPAYTARQSSPISPATPNAKSFPGKD